jgi:hypothetical protein
MTRITAVVTIVALLQTVAFHAQAPVHTPDGWDTVVTAPPGTRVRLVFLDGSIVNGRLAEARADALVLKDISVDRGRLVARMSSQGDTYTVDRAQIAKAQAHVEGTVKRMSGKKRVLMGLAAAGAVIGGVLLALFAWCSAGNSRCGA